jgi:nucleotide-binding universal stress UspA family protein
MAIYHTILHPTDFEEISVEAFRVARSLAQLMGAKLTAFHVASPPVALQEDGRVILDPADPTPVDLWTSYRAAATDTPAVAVQYSVVISKSSDTIDFLKPLVGDDPKGALIVMGSQGRTGIRRMIWGNSAEDVVRTAPCAVLVVKKPY